MENPLFCKVQDPKDNKVYVLIDDYKQPLICLPDVNTQDVNDRKCGIINAHKILQNPHSYTLNYDNYRPTTIEYSHIPCTNNQILKDINIGNYKIATMNSDAAKLDYTSIYQSASYRDPTMIKPEDMLTLTPENVNKTYDKYFLHKYAISHLDTDSRIKATLAVLNNDSVKNIFKQEDLSKTSLQYNKTSPTNNISTNNTSNSNDSNQNDIINIMKKNPVVTICIIVFFLIVLFR